MTEIEISLFTPLMGNWYAHRRYLHAHRSPVTEYQCDGRRNSRPYIRHKKFIKMLSSLSFYCQIRRYKHSYIFGFKQAYINFIYIGRHLFSSLTFRGTTFRYEVLFLVLYLSADEKKQTNKWSIFTSLRSQNARWDTSYIHYFPVLWNLIKFHDSLPVNPVR